MLKTVFDVMTSNPIVAQPEMPLKEAIKILVEKKISGLPVVDAQNKLVGVMSHSDLMWRTTGPTPPPYIMLLDSVIFLENPTRYEEELHKVLGETVGDVMSHKPITTTPDTPLSQAARLMHDRNVHRLPVVDQNDNLIGILTRGDIVRSMANE